MFNDEIKMKLERERDAQLEALELKVQQQQEVIVLQQQKINEILANPFPLQYPSSSANSNDKNAVAAAAAMPKSCADLRYFEQTVNGMYLIMETEKVETVFCDLPIWTRFLLSSDPSKIAF